LEIFNETNPGSKWIVLSKKPTTLKIAAFELWSSGLAYMAHSPACFTKS